MQAKPSTNAHNKRDAQPVQSPVQGPDGQHPAKMVDTTYTMIGGILQGGVILSAAVIIIGLIRLSLQPDKFAPQKLQMFPQTFGQVWTGLLALRPQAVITFGLLLLIATPVIRVAVSIVAFAMEHDRRFVGITTLVLLILLFSIFYVGAVVVVGQHQQFQHGEYSWVYPVLIFVGAIVAGLLGSLVGLGGGGADCALVDARFPLSDLLCHWSEHHLGDCHF